MKKLMREKGFALMTVMLMTAVILILMISLVSLSSQTLYQATRGMEKASLMPYAESALNEVILNMQKDLEWGTHNEKLYMKVGGQEPSLAGLKDSDLPSVNSAFSFQGKACYYVSFDPNDSAFSGTKYISVNNLKESDPADNWRGTDKVPANCASIIVTVAVGNTVRHFEALVTMTTSASYMKMGARGEANFIAKEFLVEKKGGSSNPEFHSNHGGGADTSIKFTLSDKIELKDNTVFSATGKVVSNKSPSDPNSFKHNQDAQDVPVVPVKKLVQSITVETAKIPCGTYEKGSDQALKHTAPDGKITNYLKDTSVVPGFYWDGEGIKFSKSLEVEFDPNNPDKVTGNLTISGSIKEVKFDADGISIYAPGDGERDFADKGKYLHGSVLINTSDEVLVGKGNIYAEGDITLKGKEMKAGAGTDDIALYAGGDINITVNDELNFNGLVYTLGDFVCDAKQVNIYGAIMSAGKDPNTDPNGAVCDPGNMSIDATGDAVKIYFDDSKLKAIAGSSGGGSTGAIRFLSWHEF
ncbi:MAG: hypothetical protein ABRQ38_13955 [Candidatus Eremiobacterota bacterium]